MIWIGTVTRTDERGVYVRARSLSGDSELGPLLSAQPRVTVSGAGLQASGAPVTGAAVGVPVYNSGDTVAISDVEGALSTFIVLCRLA